MKQVIIIVSCLFLLSADLAVAEIWMDDFEGDTLNEKWTPIERRPFAQRPPDWKLEDGILVGRWPDWNGQFLFLEEYPSLDYTMQVRCRIDDLLQLHGFGGAGFVFRSPGPDRIEPFYGFAINNFCAEFGTMHGNLEFNERHWEQHHFGQWYTLKLLVKDTIFLGYVDNRPVCKMDDERYKDSFVGLMMGSHTHASFDDFMITDQVDEDALSKAFGVSPDATMALATTWADLKIR